RAVTAALLENQEQAIREEREFLSEAVPTNNTGSSGATAGFSASASGATAGFDPVLISLIRRSMPNLVAYDLAGVQPMTGPTGLIFAMRSRFESMTGAEALFDEADTSFSANSSAGVGEGDIGNPYVAGSNGKNVGFGTTGSSTQSSDPSALNPSTDATQKAYTTGIGMDTEKVESLGTESREFRQMGFSIEKVTVTAKSRALKA
ncbi:MAG: ATP-binding protein, partial [Pseudomonadota bacterium]|nr:ATP-binding protein [Pseudomonadota bacterium]